MKNCRLRRCPVVTRLGYFEWLADAATLSYYHMKETAHGKYHFD